MLKKELVKEWAIKQLIKNRATDDISNKIYHVENVNVAAKALNPLREDSDALGCVEHIPNSMRIMKILISKSYMIILIRCSTGRKLQACVLDCGMWKH